MSRRRNINSGRRGPLILYDQTRTFEGQDIGLNQLLNCSIQSGAVLGIMTWCSLMENTREVGPIPTWHYFWHLSECPCLDKFLLKQGGKQLRIRHRDQIKLRLPLNTLQWVRLLVNPLSRLLLTLLL